MSLNANIIPMVLKVNIYFYEFIPILLKTNLEFQTVGFIGFVHIPFVAL